jgi:hypothetical protein
VWVTTQNDVMIDIEGYYESGRSLPLVEEKMLKFQIEL